jgi:predicted membrane protein
MARFIFGVILILLGLSAFFSFSLVKVLFAALLIYLGVKLLTHHRGGFSYEPAVSHDDRLNEVAIFSPVNRVVRTESFHGGKFVLIFSGGELDLRDAKAAGNEVILDLAVIFGGCKLYLPADWRVSTQGATILGGVNVKGNAGQGEVTLRLKGAVIFGGIEVER